jgi:hypothetical protein
MTVISLSCCERNKFPNNNNNNNNNKNNGDKMDTNVIEHQKRDQESKVENNSHPSAEGEQHIIRNTLKEDLHIMWH